VTLKPLIDNTAQQLSDNISKPVIEGTATAIEAV